MLPLVLGVQYVSVKQMMSLVVAPNAPTELHCVFKLYKFAINTSSM